MRADQDSVNMLKSPDTTDWLSATDQQAWFDRFKSLQDQGIKFNQFQEFLKATIYTYFARVVKSKNGNGEANASRFSYQQEMLLFKVFDSKKDNIIDREEFAFLCNEWLERTYRRSCALVVVDVQNDFIDGSLALINGPAGQDGADVVPVINKIVDECAFDAVVYTQDWHPINHIGFYDNLHLRQYTLKSHDEQTNGNRAEGSKECVSNGITSSVPGPNAGRQEDTRFKLKKLVTSAKLFDTVLFDEGRMEQKLWPIHCVQNSWGAELHPGLRVVPNAIRIYKGTLSQVDAYSAFWDNMRLNETGLRQKLKSRNIDDIFFCGLALDYCVAASAIDAARAGFTTFVIEDACRGIDQQEIERRKKEMLDCGVYLINSNMISSYLLQLKDCKPKGGIALGKREPTSSLSTVATAKENSIHGLSLSVTDEEFDGMLLVDICFKRALALGA